ncbi:MAG: L,D-transpeptidase [Kofleriaceae bacterium]
MTLVVAIAAIAMLAACGPAEPRRAPIEKAAPTAPAPPARVARRIVIPETARTLVAVVPDTWSSTTAKLSMWGRYEGRWAIRSGPSDAVIGKAGAAWGIGLHGDGAPPGLTGPSKREGDGASPAGVFSVGRSFGTMKERPYATPYQRVNANWKCVDDPASRSYNLVLDQRTVTKDWSSAEDMVRSDELYDIVLEINHNPGRVPGKGSCIFLHVWGGPEVPTIGCTAYDPDQLFEAMLAISTDTVFVLLPRAEFEALASEWGLPALDKTKPGFDELLERDSMR